ncbi:MAG: sulfate reduction electron transfer complex DsrMKJOP subunit DsrJ [Candidatus Riflebacteria bacterium]|nr:sulfate reduction electron transfer complex DsrMKJOP subunit DsrJ [Candidatus Riflebacteria bacterium]
MNDRKVIIGGLVIFFILVTFPTWFTVATGNVRKGQRLNETLTEAKKAARAKGECVEPASTMRLRHMELLNDWRDQVVREKKRIYVSSSGRRYRMSLSGTCVDCHGGSKKFCTQCHDAVGSTLFCWDCHSEKGGSTP